MMAITGSLLLLCPQVLEQGLPQSELAPWLSEVERRAGWVELMDGHTLTGWRSARSTAPPSGWQISEGCLHKVPTLPPADLLSDGVYTDFELELEWRLAAQGNSGIKYRVALGANGEGPLGPEYQLLADQGSTKVPGEHRTGAIYDLFAPLEHVQVDYTQFHYSRIVVERAWIEHWLDGVRLLRVPLGDSTWQAQRARSKFANVPDFGQGAGHIMLQDHGSEVWFRRIRLRDRSRAFGQPVELYDGKSLSGWKTVGDALWSAEVDALHGRVGGGAQSFLYTERKYGDFLLELELKNELPGNSGIQVRSQVMPGERMVGYQIEVDPSPRAWSGGLYDEGRRAWLQDLRQNEAGRAAFHSGEWNHYRIECVGPSLRAWVNGVPTADYLDPLDLSGVIALQVHSGDNTSLRWRNFALRDLGQSRWRSGLDVAKPTWRGGMVSDPGATPLAIDYSQGALCLYMDAASTARALELMPPTGEFCLRLVCSGSAATLTFAMMGAAESSSSEVRGELSLSGEPSAIYFCAFASRLKLIQDGRSLGEWSNFRPAQSLRLWGKWDQTLRIEALDWLEFTH